MKNRPMNVLGGSENAHVENLNANQVHGDYHFHAAQVRPEDKSVHELLQPIEDASHTRDRKRSPPNSACARGTRVDVVKKVTTWAASDISDPDEPHILWMHGYVGCGKSAISQEVCEQSDRQGRPVVSFFFFRNMGDRSKIWRLPTTLASQMATVIPETEPFIRAAVKASPALTRPDEGGVSLVARMQRLIYRPFKASVEAWKGARGLEGGPFLIVLDGLDECNDKEQVQELIDDMLLFFEENHSIPLRVFITSRVEQHLQSHLDVPGVCLDNLVDHCSDDDVATFLEVLFENERRRNPVIRAYIRQHGEWPTAGDKQRLVRHIDGSFIFASLLFKYIMGLTASDGSGSPTTPMDRLPHTLNMNPGLDGLYTQTLACSEHLPYFLNIISTIALLEWPLPASGIAELLGISTYEVVNVLVNLQAIIQVPGTDDIPVTVCHTSLRDFLTTESRSDRYFAQPRHHVHLFLRCLECELEFYRWNPGVGVPTILDYGELSPALEYALRFSMNHLKGGRGLFEQSDWDSSIQLCRQILELVPASPGPVRLDRVHTVTRTMASVPWMMNFNSLPSCLKKEGADWRALYHPKQVSTTTAAGTAKRGQPVDVELVHTLQLGSAANCVEFSADGRFLAIGCFNGNTYIYNVQTCALAQEFMASGESDMIWSLSFSLCGRWLATGTHRGIIRIWDIAGNYNRGTFDGHRGIVSGLEFSPDGRLLISGSLDKTARVWDVGSALVNPPSTSSSITSRDGPAKSIVLTTRDRALEESRKIDVDGDATYPSNDSSEMITSITISPDGRYVAASSLDNLIRLWDLQRISAGEWQPPVLLERWKGHENTVWSLSFVKNGRFLVSAGEHGDVGVWDVGHLGIVPAPDPLFLPSSSSGEAGNRNFAKGDDRPVTGGKKSRCTMRLVGHRNGVTSTVAVSPDGRWVVSGSMDGGVLWWDLGLSSAEVSSSLHEEPSTMSTTPVTQWGLREAICRLEGHESCVNSVGLSPVGNMLATGSDDGLVRIWSYTSA